MIARPFRGWPAGCRCMRIVGVLAMIAFVYWRGGVPAWAGQWIMGTLSIRDDNGRLVYGEYVTVFLTTQHIPVPRSSGLEAMERHRRLDRINQLHLDYYKQFARHRSQKGYLAAQAETSETGNFAFLNVPPGRYFIVVTFPAMVGGYKVAWQHPVSVTADRRPYVALNEDNLVLPAVRR
ncbi:MAG TPA: carboxypeptidase-like regulatory domain-containing protein [Desulfosarcina sp.]|nr:carboxypeptidase-like regulatory domain-containing protein [Desulfosarcina sp.]